MIAFLLFAIGLFVIEAADLPPVLTVDEVAAFLRTGRSATYEAVRVGQIPSIRVGRKIRVSRDQLLAALGNGNGTGPVDARELRGAGGAE